MRTHQFTRLKGVLSGYASQDEARADIEKAFLEIERERKAIESYRLHVEHDYFDGLPLNSKK